MVTFKAQEINVGYHPDGFRIDKTTGPMERYTQWEISPEGTWSNPAPVCFHALPANGWHKADHFEWGGAGAPLVTYV
jgi:hypothetical protein